LQFADRNHSLLTRVDVGSITVSDLMSRIRLFSLVAACAWLGWSGVTSAHPGNGAISQSPPGSPVQQSQPPKPQASPKADKEELGPPEVISLTTKDNVVLKCTYYPGEKSKTTVPLILLHDWDGNRKDMAAMADYLQKNYKFAVIVPDLRGHGESTEVVGAEQPLLASSIKKEETALIVNDIERCKKFLMEKNNLGELNIEMLTLVAIGKANVVAVQWALNDWRWPRLGGLKQGQDVKAVMMISPERKLLGLTMTQNLKSDLFTGKGTKPLAVYLAWSAKDETADREGNSIARALEKPRAKLDDSMLLVHQPYNTNLDGTALVQHTLVFDDLAKFITDKLIANKELLPWQDRSK
jgi:hypothetical protein